MHKYMYNVHVHVQCTMYMYNVHVQCTLYINKWTDKRMDEFSIFCEVVNMIYAHIYMYMTLHVHAWCMKNTRQHNMYM